MHCRTRPYLTSNPSYFVLNLYTSQVAAWKVCQNNQFELSEEEAQHWLTTAANRGDAECQFSLALQIILDDDRDDDRDDKWSTGFTWLLRAGKQGKSARNFT